MAKASLKRTQTLPGLVRFPRTHEAIKALAYQYKVSILSVTRRLLRSLTDQDPTGVLWIVDDRRIRVREASPKAGDFWTVS